MSSQPYSDETGDKSYAEVQEEQNDTEGGWIETYKGNRFWPLNPNPEDIDMVDVSHALSMNCRYNGHTKAFYSVAEHCVIMSGYAQMDTQDEEIALWALLHDATEAYLPDMPRPIKSLVNGFDEAEERFHRVIAERFDLPYPIPEIIHKYDNAILVDEARQLMESGGEDWVLPEEGLGIEVQCWRPAQAEYKYIQRYQELTDEEINYTFAGGI